MTGRARTIFAIFLALALPAAGRPSAGAAPPAGRFNLLLITIDTLRPDRLSCYGSPSLRTPVIDSLAARGGVFLRAFAQTTTTLPSHANILLGLTPLAHGVHDNSNFVVPPGIPAMAEWLKHSGYATAAVVGAYPLDARFGLARGFDLYDDEYGWQNFENLNFVERKAEAVVSRGLEWLKKQKEPWFLWVHCFDPHAPYDPPDPFKSQYAGRLYDGEVAYTDAALKPLVDELEARGVRERTVVILTADHGESLGQHGESTHGYLAYNSSLWVPLIICVPGLKPVKVPDPVSHQDIFPTVCDILGITAPGSLPGGSLLPAMNGKKLAERPFYFESLYPYYSRGWAPLRGIVAGKNKFIDSPIPEVYDLAADFDETHNLADNQGVADWRGRLAKLMGSQAKVGKESPVAKADAKTLEKLRSLGYVGGRQTAFKETFGPEDDVKTLLPLNNRAEAALRLYQDGQVQKAVAELTGILAERKDVDLVYTTLGLIYRKEGKKEQALEILRQGLERLPANYEIFVAYVSALVNAGRYDELVERIQARDDPREEQDPEIWNALGVAYSHQGKLEEAVKAYEKALTVDRDFPKVWSNLGTVYLIFFSRTQERRWLDLSLECFRKALALDPGSASANNGLGAAHREAGDMDLAIADWERAVAADPNFGNALYNLGTAYLDKGEKAKALTYLDKYKTLYYASLGVQDRAKLDELIRQCR